MEKIIKCKACGNEMAKSAKSCPNCGARNKKPFFKKWWFWGIIVVVLIIVVASSGGNETNTTNQAPKNTENEVNETETITYEVVDLNSMIESLKSNALKAEAEYQDKYVEVAGKIKSFDSDGAYITIEPTTADEWNFDSAMCYIKDENQKNFLIEKNVGDVVTVKGKIKSIGEVLGYQIDIEEIK